MQITETGIPRRGIKPFEKGTTRELDGQHAKTIDSPKLGMGGSGLLYLQIVVFSKEELKNQTEYADNQDVYVINEEGDIVSGQGRDLLEKGYGQLFIWIDPETTDPDEMYKKGPIDCLVWISEDKILRGKLQQQVELSGLLFELEGDEGSGQRSVLIATNAPLERINISIETHIEPTLGGAN